MARRFFSPASAALLTAIILPTACSQQNASPAAPTETPLVQEALAPGVTLKSSMPTLLAPASDVRTDTLTPQFMAGPSTALHATGHPPFEYRFEVQTPDGQVFASSPKVTADPDGPARWTIHTPLLLDKPYRWRVRAELGDRLGPWSNFSSFLSLDYRGLVPRPANGAWPSNGPAVVAYISESFPDYLHPTGSLGQRQEHMEFLRDRIIEAGVCGGMDVALNRKRGFGPYSHDAIAWRKPNGFIEVVDIASAFDDNGIPLRLHWSIVAGPPGYTPMPDHPGC